MGKRAECDQERELARKAGERPKQLLQGRTTMDVHGVDTRDGEGPSALP